MKLYCVVDSSVPRTLPRPSLTQKYFLRCLGCLPHSHASSHAFMRHMHYASQITPTHALSQITFTNHDLVAALTRVSRRLNRRSRWREDALHAWRPASRRGPAWRLAWRRPSRRGRGGSLRRQPRRRSLRRSHSLRLAKLREKPQPTAAHVGLGCPLSAAERQRRL